MIEAHFEEAFVAALAAREKQIQQHYRPAIGVHKWFARRSGALFRSLLLAEFAGQPVSKSYDTGHELMGRCLDPFMGGGTPLMEASRMGLAVEGYDTNPMARWIVERSLEDMDPELFLATGQRVVSELEPQTLERYLTECPLCGRQVQARYFIWVRTYECRACGVERPFLSDTLVVSPGLHRYRDEIHLCLGCGSLNEITPANLTKVCTTCGQALATTTPCPCGEPLPDAIEATQAGPGYTLVAVEYRCSSCRDPKEYGGRLFKAADPQDLARYAEASAMHQEPRPLRPNATIPDGDETSRLRRVGYDKWTDLFNGRQLSGLDLLAERLSSEPSGPVKAGLLTAFSDFLRYQNMLCRYDRQALKPIDIFGLHGFAMPRVICEVPLLGSPGGGSGGFRNALAKYARAKRWCRSPYELTPSGRMPTPPERIGATVVSNQPSNAPRSAALWCESLNSTSSGEPSDVVLTDPPYYDSIHYGELMDFCYQWLRLLAPGTAYFQAENARSADDAVGSRWHDVNQVDYSARLSRVFVAATARLLPSRPFCFTYHHSKLEAYVPIVVACLDAGLLPTAVYACPSEMRVSSHLRSRKAASVDSVFVLRKPPLPPPATGFSPGEASSTLARQLRHLRAAKVTLTSSDRTCLRLGVAAIAATASNAPSWHPANPIRERFKLALDALSLFAEGLS